MNEELGLSTLSSVMGWPSDRLQKEYAWIRMMSRIKYDAYRDYVAGVRFVESLIMWLQQFDKKDRDVAYQFIRKQLVYFSPPEIFKLVETFYWDYLEEYLISRVCNDLNIPTWDIWINKNAVAAFNKLQRQTLIL